MSYHINVPDDVEHPDLYVKAAQRRIRNNALKTWRATANRAGEIEDFLLQQPDGQGFIGVMKLALSEYGRLSDGQGAAVLRTIEDRAREQAVRGQPLTGGLYVGTVGAREEMTLTVRRMLRREEDGVVSYFYVLNEPTTSATVIYRGTCCLASTEGVTIKIKATIKEHGQRKGYPQTVIQRPKVLS